MLIDITGDGLYVDPAKITAIWHEPVRDVIKIKVGDEVFLHEESKTTTQEMFKKVNDALGVIEKFELDKLQKRLEIIRELDLN